MTTNEDLLQREITLEEEMLSLGAKRFWEGVTGAKQAGQESGTVYGQQLAKKAVVPLRDAIVAFQGAVQRGPKHIALRYLKLVDPEVAAFITVKAVLDCITQRRTIQKTAVAIGAGIEDEVRFTIFKTENKALFNKIMTDLNKKGYVKERKRGVLVHSMNKAAGKGQPELEWQEWPQKDKFHLGYKLIDLLVQASGDMIRVVTINNGPNNSSTIIEPTEETMRWIDEKTERCSLLAPVYLPTIIPPKPWTTPMNGGYHSKAVRPMKLVKTRQTNYLEELYHKRDEMPLVYEAVNALQATAWRVNKPVLDVMRRMWEQGHEVGDMPAGEPLPMPPKPHDIDTNKDARTQWKHAASKVHTSNAKLKSRRMQMVKLMFMAEKFEKEEAIYFPHQLDFRGRVYAVPSYLNPQGNDMAKALLEFAEGKPVGESGHRWLKIHAANCYGVDKVSMDERVKWAEENLANIDLCARDPFSFRWWTEADKPWQFLAVCFELFQLTFNPHHVSHLAVSVDGACNGLQNFSAMLRDAVGGRAVNLVPSSKPADIYQRVADVAMRRVEEDAKGDSENAGYAAQWLQFGFDRKAAKRPVMTLPYGAKQYSARQYVCDYVEERVEKGAVAPWGDEHFDASVYLTKHIWDSIGEVVVAARSAMDWLQKVASLAASEELPVNWTTPVGFPVLQAYADMKPRRIDTVLGDRLVKCVLQEETDKLDRKRQASGISPNFVHSMDAAALMLSVHRCREAGITHFGMVHDSYGTHAADMETMAVCLREAFVELYQTDVLEEFRSSIAAGLSDKNLEQLPPVPAKGSLDLSLVKKSVYFFA